MLIFCFFVCIFISCRTRKHTKAKRESDEARGKRSGRISTKMERIRKRERSIGFADGGGNSHSFNFTFYLIHYLAAPREEDAGV
jgi:hypothetical protein